MKFIVPGSVQMPNSDVKDFATWPCKSRSSGFTLVEMISVLIIFAILALVALPRFFDPQNFYARIFFDHARSMLRDAQKIAIAQNRNVYVRLNGSSIAFCFTPFGGGGSCGTPVLAPGGNNSGSTNTLASCNSSNVWFCEAAPNGVSYAAAPATQYFFFSALGKPFYPADPVPVSNFVTLDLTFNGGGSARHIYVEAETGYVHP
jgi:MSHA pilin protein MshC